MTLNYEQILNMIENRERFSWSRWGDGEWNCISQDTKSRKNCDHHQYFPDMGEKLDTILKSKPDYYLGLQSLAYRQRKKQIDSYGIEWVEGNILHRQSGKGRLQPFFDVLNERDVLVIGPKHIQKIYPDHLKDPYFLEIPHNNCWLEYEKISGELGQLIDLKDWVVLFCSSMMSNVLIDEVHGRGTLIDTGSVLDPYCGVKSRGYHINMTV